MAEAQDWKFKQGDVVAAKDKKLLVEKAGRYMDSGEAYKVIYLEACRMAHGLSLPSEFVLRKTTERDYSLVEHLPVTEDAKLSLDPTELARQVPGIEKHITGM